MILMEIVTDLSVFGDAAHFTSWAGVCTGNHESAGKRKTGKSATAIMPFATCSAKQQPTRRAKCSLSSRFQSLVGRKGHKATGRFFLAHKPCNHHSLRSRI